MVTVDIQNANRRGTELIQNKPNCQRTPIPTEQRRHTEYS